MSAAGWPIFNTKVWHAPFFRSPPAVYHTQGDGNERSVDFILRDNRDALVLFEMHNNTNRTLHLHVYEVKNNTRQLYLPGEGINRLRGLPSWSGLLKIEAGELDAFVFQSVASDGHSNIPVRVEIEDLDTKNVLVLTVNREIVRTVEAPFDLPRVAHAG